MTTDTIYAPSTAIGGAIALIRVSGPSCADIAKKMLDRDVTKTPRMLRFARMVDGERVLDDGMACFLPGNAPSGASSDCPCHLMRHSRTSVLVGVKPVFPL